tara:strand:+ start:675 stop:1199 length:525 start_codon:yes stop_codon:yes gene_type:complete
MPQYRKLNEETNTQFMARVMNTENRAMRPIDVLALCDQRTWRNRTKEKVQAYLCTAVKHGLLCKWKDTTTKRMIYGACKLMPTWAEARPIPAYTKGEYTRTVEVIDDEPDDEVFPNLVETLAAYHQVSIQQVKDAISNHIMSITMNNTDVYVNALILSLKEVCIADFITNKGSE